MFKSSVLFFIGLLLLSGCSSPTSSSIAVDDRPQISFTAADKSTNLSSHDIYIDGLKMGNAQQYTSGKNALRVLSGTHLLEVKEGENTVTTKTFFISDGITKGFVIK